MGIIKNEPKRSSASLTMKSATTPAAPGKIRVYATATGFYDGHRIRPGQSFLIRSETEFAPRWMSKTEPGDARATTAGPSPATSDTTLDVLGGGEPLKG